MIEKNTPIDQPTTPAPPHPSPEEEANLLVEPVYCQLLEQYQNAAWKECSQTLLYLLEKYPHSPRLLEFQKDLELRLVVQNINTIQVSENRSLEKKGQARNLLVFLLIILVFGGTVYYILSQGVGLITQKTMADQRERLDALYVQAQNLIPAGKPDVAIRIIEEIRAVDPQYPGLDTLSIEAYTITLLDKRYNEAIQYLNAKKYEEALVLLEEIGKERPAYRDVKVLIDQIKGQEAIDAILNTGLEAYTKGQWKEAIKAFEQALDTDQEKVTPETKDKLLKSYFKEINKTLANSNATAEEIVQIEVYYKKATDIFPKTSQSATDRETLQQAGKDISVFKYYREARALIDGPSISLDTADQVVDALNKILLTDPNHETVKAELEKAQMFQTGFNYFNNMEWGRAIPILKQLYYLENDYGKGKVQQILYEAYTALGSDSFTTGNYREARLNFEAAENIVWGQPNSLPLFQVQLKLGDTLAKLKDYKNSISYYSYALNAIDINARLKDHIEITDDIAKAEAFNKQKRYLDAYTLYTKAIKTITEKSLLFSIRTTVVESTSSLALVAYANASTIDAIRESNPLAKLIVIQKGTTLSIPYLK